MSPPCFAGQAHFVLEHETRFELATLTLANESRNRVNACLCLDSFDSWSGLTRH